MKSTSGDRRAQRTGRSNKIYTGPVIVLPKSLLNTDEMRALPASATKLLLAALPQYNGPGTNNGGLRILMRQPRRYGFKSGATLTQARDDLLRSGFLQITRQGGRNIPTLYCFTWMGVDSVPGADIRANPTPSHLWQKHNSEHRELPSRGKREAPVLNSSKNAKPAPVIGAIDTKTAPVLGTCPPAIAPVIGAVRAKTGSRVAPVSGTDSCIAMRSAMRGVEVDRESDLDAENPPPQKDQPQHPVTRINEFDRALARWQQRQASLARRRVNPEKGKVKSCQH